MTTPAAVPNPEFNTLGRFFRELDRRSRVLAVTGWIHLALLAGISVISLFDSRPVSAELKGSHYRQLTGSHEKWR